MLETTKPICTEKEVFKVYLSLRRQKGYCCFSLLRDFRVGPLTHSPCQGGINDPKQLPLGIPTHQNIFVTYRILRIYIFVYKYINIIAIRKTCQIRTNLPCNPWADEKADNIAYLIICLSEYIWNNIKVIIKTCHITTNLPSNPWADEKADNIAYLICLSEYIWNNIKVIIKTCHIATNLPCNPRADEKA